MPFCRNEKKSPTHKINDTREIYNLMKKQNETKKSTPKTCRKWYCEHREKKDKKNLTILTGISFYFKHTRLRIAFKKDRKKVKLKTPTNRQRNNNVN